MNEEGRLRGLFAPIVGEENVSQADAMPHYTVEGKRPGVILSPETPAQIMEILSIADRERFAVIPSGGGTKLHLGNIPTKVDIILSTSKLDSILEYEPADLTVSVQSGMRLSKLQEALSANGQMLPLDPPWGDRSTLGGIVAANSSGPWRFRYGTVRDLLIGVEVVHPSGKLTRAGGKVVKNVTGYDMNKLYTGSLGALGVITRLNFRLRPIPPASGTLLAYFRDLQDAVHVATSIVQSELLPTALEGANPEAARRLLGPAGLEPPEGSCALIVRVEEVQGAVERELRQMEETAVKNRSAGVRTLRGDEETDLWGRLRDFPTLFAGQGEGSLLLRIGSRRSDMGRVIARAEREWNDASLECLCLGHAGNGITYLGSPLGGGDDLGDRLYNLLARFSGFVRGLGGYTVVEDAPLTVKERLDVWGHAQDGVLKVTRGLKSAFDPKGTLNPGRLLGKT